MVIKETLAMPGFLPDTRTVHIYLPDDYHEEERYDVLYMFDGHNLFFDSDATYGKSWGLKDYLDTHPEKLLVVGIECSHEGNERLNEYCPYTVKNAWKGGKITGKGRKTMEFITKVLKPCIDANFSTNPDREHTYIAGSSMGGLMSLYAMIRYKKYFSAAACLSPSISFCMPQLRKAIEQAGGFSGCYIYMDMGSEEMKGHTVKTMDSLLSLSHMLTVRGAVCYPRIAVGGGHNEASWEKQIPVFLDFILRKI